VGSVFTREPVGQVQDDAREKARLGYTKKKTENVEGGGVVAEGHQGGDDSPADHDAGDPESGSRTVQNEVGRDFKNKVTDEKDACTCSKHGIGEPGHLAHREFGKAYVDPVNISQDVTGEEDGDESEGDLAVDGGVSHKSREECRVKVRMSEGMNVRKCGCGPTTLSLGKPR